MFRSFYNSKRNGANQTKKKDFSSHKNDRRIFWKKKRKKVKQVEISHPSDKTDQQYELLLQSIYDKLGAKKECEKLIVELPIVLPVGTKKTTFSNLVRVCKSVEGNQVTLANT